MILCWVLIYIGNGKFKWCSQFLAKYPESTYFKFWYFFKFSALQSDLWFVHAWSTHDFIGISHFKMFLKVSGVCTS